MNFARKQNAQCRWNNRSIIKTERKNKNIIDIKNATKVASTLYSNCYNRTFYIKKIRLIILLQCQSHNAKHIRVHLNANTQQDKTRDSRSRGLGGPDPLRICRKGQSMFDPLKCHIFHSKLLLDNTASFTSSRMKDLCQKWKVKLIFWGAWNSLMAWPDWPWPPTPYCTTDLRHYIV